MDDMLKTFTVNIFSDANETMLAFNETANRTENDNLNNAAIAGNLLDRLERIAVGWNVTLGNASVERKELEIAFAGLPTDDGATDLPLAAGRAPPPHMTHTVHTFRDHSPTEEYAHAVSDIWIGVILTLLVLFVIFFICACLLYHKIQQWKHAYRASHEPVEVCRHYPADYEIESLPSYTIVSGLPTYDDALEQFRKAGIILSPTFVPVIKIFENAPKEKSSADSAAREDPANAPTPNALICTCGGSSPNTGPPAVSSQHAMGFSVSPYSSAGVEGAAALFAPQVIELSPEQLAILSQKRLSLQIAFNSTGRRQSRPNTTLRSQLLRTRAVQNAAGMPPLHQFQRSSSVISLSSDSQPLNQSTRYVKHRGSLY